MKAVILCGGMGIRLKEATEFKPKPMVMASGKSILWHIRAAGNSRDTGEAAFKGARIKKVEKYLDQEIFMVAHVDGRL